MSAAEGLLLDMDGVLTVSWDPIPGAAEAVRRLRDAGLQLRVITSTTSRTGVEMAANLRRLGIPVEDDEVLTAAMSARDHLLEAHPGARVFLLGDAHLYQAAVAGGPHRDLHLHRLDDQDGIVD